MSEPTAPQTPEAATPHTAPIEVRMHEAQAKRNEGQPGMPQGPCLCPICRTWRELQAVTAERDDIAQHQEVLRTALATAEARVKALETLQKGGDAKCAAHVEKPLEATLIAQSTDSKQASNAASESDPQTAADLRRQLAEAQAACVAKDEALRKINKLGVDATETGKLGVDYWSQVQWLSCVAIKDTNPGTDLLKRLADAESHATDVEDEKAELAAELSRLHAEVKELREALQDMAGMPNHDQDDAHRLRHKAKKALEAIDAARTQPKS